MERRSYQRNNPLSRNIRSSLRSTSKCKSIDELVLLMQLLPLLLPPLLLLLLLLWLYRPSFFDLELDRFLNSLLTLSLPFTLSWSFTLSLSTQNGQQQVGTVHV